MTRYRPRPRWVGVSFVLCRFVLHLFWLCVGMAIGALVLPVDAPIEKAARILAWSVLFFPLGFAFEWWRQKGRA